MAKYINVVTWTEIQDGDSCDVLYQTDGKFYPALIEKRVETGYQIRFKTFKTKETVPIEYIRVSPQQLKENRQWQDQELDSFKIPEHLKLLATDTEEVWKQKRKKVKAIKFTHKMRLIDKSNKEKQDTWL